MLPVCMELNEIIFNDIRITVTQFIIYIDRDHFSIIHNRYGFDKQINFLTVQIALPARVTVTANIYFPFLFIFQGFTNCLSTNLQDNYESSSSNGL